jgi:hypothetical protein
MKRSWILFLALAAAAIVASVGSARGAHPTPSSGALHVTKECSEYHGQVGEFCTITASNIKQIKRGMRVVYLQAMTPAGLDSDLVLSAAHGPAHRSAAYGHVVLSSTTSHITFTGGIGKFDGFHADATVSQDAKGLWHWDGTYSFPPHK